MGDLIVIGSHNYKKYQSDQVVDGEHKARGLIPRDYTTHPRGHYPTLDATDFPLIQQAEWDARIDDKTAAGSWLEDVERAHKVPCLDQDSFGFCWGHSATGCVMSARAAMNQPTVGLSAFSICCKIKDFRDEGGWGAQAADYIAQHGVASEGVWPQRSVDRSLDNASTWADAAKYKITGQWADLAAAQYDRNLSWQQYVTLLLSDCPVVCDYSWWSHSVRGVSVVKAQAFWGVMRDDGSGKLMDFQSFNAVWFDGSVAAGLGMKIRNSWGDSWGQQGYGVLAAGKSVPDGGVGLRAVLAA